MIEVHPQGHHVIIRRDEPLAVMALTWAEANELREQLVELDSPRVSLIRGGINP